MTASNKKLVILFIVSALSFSEGTAQNSLKIFTNFLYLNSFQQPSHFDYERAVFTYNHLSFAYRYHDDKGRIQEWELRGLLKSEAGDNHRVDQFDMHIRYENGKYLKKEFFKKIKFQLGYAGKLFYLYENVSSLNYNLFPVTRNIGGFNAAVFAHLEFDLTERIYLDLNTSFVGATVGVDFTRVQNPGLSERQQKQGGWDFDFLGERILRVGVGFRLGYFGDEDQEDELQKEWDEKQKKKGGKKKKKRKKKRKKRN